MKVLLKKYLKYFGIAVGAFLILLISLSIIISVFFKKQLQDFVIGSLNKSLNARIEIKNTDVSIIKSFPYVSFSFYDVITHSSKDYISLTGRNDTLISAKEIHLEFNLMKLFQHQYVLKRIQINSGRINIMSIKGLNNYEIFKSNDSVSLTPNIDLKLIKIKNCIIKYYNSNNKVLVCLNTDKLLIIGKINSKLSEFNIDCKSNIELLNLDDHTILKQQPIQADLNFSSTKEMLKFADSKIKISGINLYFNSYFRFSPTSFIEANIKGDKIDIGQFLKILPARYISFLNSYKFNGNLNFILTVKGYLKTNIFPHINLNFSILDGSVNRIHSNLEFSNLHFNGFYTNGNNNNLNSSRVAINDFSTNFNTGIINLSGYISNFSKPIVDLNTSCNLNLSNLKEFLKLDTFEILKGNIENKLHVSGSLLSLSNFNLKDFYNLNYKGDCNFQDVSFKVKHNNFDLNSINGLVNIDNDLKFNNISFFIHKDKLLLDGIMNNGLSYLFHKTNNATLDAHLTSNSIDLSNYFVKGDSVGNKNYSREFLFPENVLLNLDLNINYFKLNRFEAKWIKGKLKYKPGMFILNSLSFDLCGGRVSGNGAIIQDNNDNFLVKGQTDISKVDISKLFYTLNNFSQDILLDENLKGKISGKINFSSIWNKILYLDTKKLLIDADITLFNGELIKFKPMYNLSKFIALDELKQIKFSTLHNNLLIKDETIYIPQMEVKSSAFNIVASGEHTFDNHYKYKIRVLLSDILYNKAKKAKRENEEFGVVEDDGLGKTTIPLSIVGYKSDYKITYDTKSSIQVIKEGFTKQKTELKQIFKEEFGWFKHDTIFDSNKKSINKPKIEWDDNSTDSNPVKTDKAKTDKRKTDKSNNSSEKVKVEWE